MGAEGQSVLSLPAGSQNTSTGGEASAPWMLYLGQLGDAGINMDFL